MKKNFKHRNGEDELPMKEGWYWLRDECLGVYAIVGVWLEEGRLVVQASGGEKFDIDCVYGRWYGPLQEPKQS